MDAEHASTQRAAYAAAQQATRHEAEGGRATGFGAMGNLHGQTTGYEVALARQRQEMEEELEQEVRATADMHREDRLRDIQKVVERKAEDVLMARRSIDPPYSTRQPGASGGSGRGRSRY
jgi:hypothetical protein